MKYLKLIEKFQNYRRFRLINDYHFTNGSFYMKTVISGRYISQEPTLNEFIIPSGTEGNAEINDDDEYIYITLEIKKILKNGLEENLDDTMSLTYTPEDFYKNFEEIHFSDFLY
jgi:hypothetical protein